MNNKKENKLNSKYENNDINNSCEEDNLSNIENINTSNFSNGANNNDNKITKKLIGCNNNRNSSLNHNNNLNNSLNLGYPFNNLAAKNKAEIIKGIFLI